MKPATTFKSGHSLKVLNYTKLENLIIDIYYFFITNTKVISNASLVDVNNDMLGYLFQINY